jgi:hypothetical protein
VYLAEMSFHWRYIIKERNRKIKKQVWVRYVFVEAIEAFEGISNVGKG